MTDEQQNVEPAETNHNNVFKRTEIEHDVTKETARDVMNTSLEELDVSPIEMHSLF